MISNLVKKLDVRHFLKFSKLLQVLFKMSYIPHETLRALLIVLKKSWSGALAGGVAGTEFGVMALKCFHK